MIVTLTINPAIDRIISVDRLAFEDRSYVNSSRESAGGRGINASSVIHSFGGATRAVITSGGEAGKRLQQLMCNCGFAIATAPVRHDIRTNLTITDKHGLTVNLNEPGPTLGKTEVARVERLVKQALDDADWLLLCGSTPPGVPSSFYGKLIALARRKKVRTLLRANGEPLLEGLEAGPTVAAPNQVEVERLLGRAMLTRAHYFEAAARIRAMGPESALISLGSRGAVAAFPEGMMEALPPRVDAVCPIGAGDAFTAAYAWSMCRTEDRAEALRWGVAAGTASARLPGMNFATLTQTEEVYRKVEVRRVE